MARSILKSLWGSDASGTVRCVLCGNELSATVCDRLYLRSIFDEGEEKVEAVKTKAERIGLGIGATVAGFAVGHATIADAPGWTAVLPYLALLVMLGWSASLSAGIGMLLGEYFSRGTQGKIRKDYFDRAKALEAHWKAEARVQT